MRFNARIPVIPLPYSDRNLAVEKELIVDYGQDGKFPNLYIVDQNDRTVLHNITAGIIDAIQGSAGDDFTVVIDNYKNEDGTYSQATVNLGDILNLLYTISLTHDEVTPFTNILNVLDDETKVKSTTIVDNSGIVYLPRTLSTNVYTPAGETVDVRLKSISKVGLAMRHVIATEERQQTFVVPYPFENYISEGNSFWIYVGGIMVDSRRYTLSADNTTVTFIDSDDYVEKDRTCTFLFWYNSATPESGVLLVMDGKYITPGTIESNRLSNTSDSIDLNDPTAIATSRAVCTLRNTLNSRIDSLAGNTSITTIVDEDSTSVELKVTIPNYTLADSNMLHLRLRRDLAPSATLQVNDGPALPIYDGNNRVAAGPLAGEIINLSYNSLEGRFYIYGTTSFKLETTYYHNAPEEGSGVIPFNLSYNPLVDKLDVYYNGIKLFPDINFTLNEDSISLLDFVSEAEDIFTFELTQIVPVKR